MNPIMGAKARWGGMILPKSLLTAPYSYRKEPPSKDSSIQMPKSNLTILLRCAGVPRVAPQAIDHKTCGSATA